MSSLLLTLRLQPLISRCSNSHPLTLGGFYRIAVGFDSLPASAASWALTLSPELLPVALLKKKNWRLLSIWEQTVRLRLEIGMDSFAPQPLPDRRLKPVAFGWE